MLHEFRCSEASPVVCPVDLSIRFKSDFEKILPKLDSYRSFIEKFNFVARTRSDLYFVVQHLSQFLKASRVPIWLLLYMC